MRLLFVKLISFFHGSDVKIDHKRGHGDYVQNKKRLVYGENPHGRTDHSSYAEDNREIRIEITGHGTEIFAYEKVFIKILAVKKQFAFHPVAFVQKYFPEKAVDPERKVVPSRRAESADRGIYKVHNEIRPGKPYE